MVAGVSGTLALVALGAAAVLGLGVTACGDDDEEPVTLGLITKQETNPFLGDDEGCRGTPPTTMSS